MYLQDVFCNLANKKRRLANKTMKKTVCILVAAITAALLVISPAALSHSDVQNAISNEAEAANVIANMDTKGLVSAPDITSSYKAYRLSAGAFAALADTSATPDLSGFDVYWHMIAADGSETLLKNENNKWQAMGKSLPGESDADTLSTVVGTTSSMSAAQPIAALSQLGADADCVACIEVPDYHTTFILFSEQGELSVIPYGSRPDLTELQNGELYSLDKALDILSDSMPLSEIADDLYGGAAAVESTNILPVIITSALFLVIIVLFAVMMVKKKHQKSAAVGV